MKALSLGLVKGSICLSLSIYPSIYLSGTIDEVDQQVNMTWVQPRVLDYTQVKRGFISSLIPISILVSLISDLIPIPDLRFTV